MAAGRPLDCLYGTGTAPGVAEPLGCEAGAGAVGSRPRPRPRGELPGLAAGCGRGGLERSRVFLPIPPRSVA